MDPIVTYCQMLDDTADPDDRVEAALALGDWIRSGGFLPHGTERAEVISNIDATLLLLSHHMKDSTA